MQSNKTFNLGKQNHIPMNHQQHQQRHQQQPPWLPVPANEYQPRSSNEGLTLDLRNFRKTEDLHSWRFVGNLPRDITEEMRKLFETEGKASEVCIHRLELWLYLLGNRNHSRNCQSRAGQHATPLKAAARVLCMPQCIPSQTETFFSMLLMS